MRCATEFNRSCDVVPSSPACLFAGIHPDRVARIQEVVLWTTYYSFAAWGAAYGGPRHDFLVLRCLKLTWLMAVLRDNVCRRHETKHS